MTQEHFKVNLKLKLIKASFLLNLGDDFADPSQQAFKKPTKDSTPSRFTICTISSEFNFKIFIYAVVQFYPWFNFYFPLFLAMVMYDYQFKPRTKLNHDIYIKMMLANWEGAGVELTSSFFFSELTRIHVFQNWWSFIKSGSKI